MKRLIALPFAVLLLSSCSGGGLSDEQRAAAEVQAEQLCQLKELDPDTFKFSVQMYKMSVGYDDGSKEVDIARETLKIARENGCVS